MPRIGLALAGDRSYPSFAAFCDGLSALGYIEGQTFEMQARFAAGHLDRLPGIAGELVTLGVDVIAVIGAVTFQAVRGATADIPIVFTVVLDPVAAGLVTDAERPGGNATGVTNYDPEQAKNQIRILKQIVPNLTKLAILGDAGVPDTLPNLYTAEAKAAGLHPQVVLLRDAEDMEEAFAAFASEGADALLSLEVPRTSTYAAKITESAAWARLPTMFGRDLARYEPLLAYGTSLAAAARQMALMVDRILKGAKPGDMPIECVRRPELIVSLGVARKIGIPIPPEVLATADQVTE
ncbi:ABC transporter substrate-binding protein [Rhizobium laguerreae]|nr:ABC transporter substrate-binding protein [Rhizobium laguerreae]